MQYQVSKQYDRGSETTCCDFNTLSEARNFIRNKMIEDAGMRVRITYRIYESFDMIEEYDPSKGQIPGGTEAQSENQKDQSTSGGQGKGAGFRPTPLNTSPRPPGMPHHWVHDEEDDDESKKK